MKNTVSLLPAEYLQLRKKKKVQGQVRAGMLAAVALLVMILLLIGAMTISAFTKLLSLQQRNLEAQAKIAELGIYEELATQTELLKSKVDSLNKTDPAWLDQLLMVADALPSGVWIKSFSGGEPERDENGTPTKIAGTLTLNGTTYGDIARAIVALEESAAQSAICTSSSNDDSGVTFQLNIVLNPILN